MRYKDRGVLLLWVTPDEYQLPLAMATSVKEMAEITGLQEDTIKWYVANWNHGKIKYPHFVTVEVGKDEDD